MTLILLSWSSLHLLNLLVATTCNLTITLTVSTIITVSTWPPSCTQLQVITRMSGSSLSRLYSTQLSWTTF